jgi:serine/threonine protein kinase
MVFWQLKKKEVSMETDNEKDGNVIQDGTVLMVPLQIGNGATFEQALRIEEYVAQGGMAQVYRARRIGIPEGTSNAEVAMKVLDPMLFSRKGTERDRFRREVMVMNVLSGHPNIVSFVGSGLMPDGNPFFLSEFVDGVVLFDIIKAYAEPLGLMSGNRLLSINEYPDDDQKQPVVVKTDYSAVPVDYVKIIVRGILRALAYSHERGIVHRDLKPDNIMVLLDEERRILDVKVLDFGIAKLVGLGAELVTQYTNTSSIVGTTAFMSYEQMDGSKEKVDHRADIFATGLIMFILLTGRRIWNCKQDPFKFCINRVNKKESSFDPALYVEHLPEALRVVVLKATQSKPEDRYQSAEEMLHALEEACDVAFAQTLEQPMVPVRNHTGSRVGFLPTQIAKVPNIGETIRNGASGFMKFGKRAVSLIMLLFLFAVVLGIGAYFVYAVATKKSPEQVVEVATQHARLVATALEIGHGDAGGIIPVSESRASSVVLPEATAVPSASVALTYRMNSGQTLRYKAGKSVFGSGNAKEALKIFLSLEQEGVRDPALLKSISTAYHKLGYTKKEVEYKMRSSGFDQVP